MYPAAKMQDQRAAEFRILRTCRIEQYIMASAMCDKNLSLNTFKRTLESVSFLTMANTYVRRCTGVSCDFGSFTSALLTSIT